MGGDSTPRRSAGPTASSGAAPREEQFALAPPANVLEQVRSPWPSREVLELVAKKTWRLVFSEPSISFVTSDTPAVFFEGLGLGNPDSELTMPLSPTLALIADHKGAPAATTVVRARPSLVREVNRRVVADAERFVFARTPQSWVRSAAHKTRPYLSRIQWNETVVTPTALRREGSRASRGSSDLESEV